MRLIAVQWLQARNPMREERVQGSDGVQYLVLFYYSDLRERDGKVAGVGYEFLGDRVARYRALAAGSAGQGKQ
ncbi:MAG TPA: hypothetical protein VEU32_17150 [Burkholderiales bacterium]|nr:hypothetical protein [Burkholderiales bacterium]